MRLNHSSAKPSNGNGVGTLLEILFALPLRFAFFMNALVPFRPGSGAGERNAKCLCPQVGASVDVGHRQPARPWPGAPPQMTCWQSFPPAWRAVASNWSGATTRCISPHSNAGSCQLHCRVKNIWRRADGRYDGPGAGCRQSPDQRQIDLRLTEPSFVATITSHAIASSTPAQREAVGRRDNRDRQFLHRRARDGPGG